MGNPLDGDARQSAGKTNRTSSRKIYSVCRHLPFIRISGVDSPAAEFGVCRFRHYGINPGQKSVKEYRFDTTENKQKRKTAAKSRPLIPPLGRDDHGISFALSVVMSYISNEALASAGTILSFAVLLLFIALGIVFDMIGVASTSATEKEFHSMAAHRVRGAREAVWMVRNAEKVSSICNDVVGDICGIISGATGALIVTHITAGGRRDQGSGLAADHGSGFCG